MLSKYLIPLFLLLGGCVQEKTPQWLLILHAREGLLTQNTLILSDVDEIVASYLGEPREEVYVITWRDLIWGWHANFLSPPKAILVYQGHEKKEQKARFSVDNPSFTDGTLTFQIKQPQGRRVTGNVGECVLFFKGACLFECPHVEVGD